jgi:flagellar biosynthesis GTPase FlhF
MSHHEGHRERRHRRHDREEHHEKREKRNERKHNDKEPRITNRERKQLRLQEEERQRQEQQKQYEIHMVEQAKKAEEWRLLLLEEEAKRQADIELRLKQEREELKRQKDSVKLKDSYNGLDDVMPIIFDFCSINDVYRMRCLCKDFDQFVIGYSKFFRPMQVYAYQRSRQLDRNNYVYQAICKMASHPGNTNCLTHDKWTCCMSESDFGCTLNEGFKDTEYSKLKYEYDRYFKYDFEYIPIDYEECPMCEEQFVTNKSQTNI